MSLLQLGVLLSGKVDINAATSPSPDIVVELLEACAFRMAADDEGAEIIVECREVEVARPRAGGSGQ